MKKVSAAKFSTLEVKMAMKCVCMTSDNCKQNILESWWSRHLRYSQEKSFFLCVWLAKAIVIKLHAFKIIYFHVYFKVCSFLSKNFSFLFINVFFLRFIDLLDGDGESKFRRSNDQYDLSPAWRTHRSKWYGSTDLSIVFVLLFTAIVRLICVFITATL